MKSNILSHIMTGLIVIAWGAAHLSATAQTKPEQQTAQEQRRQQREKDRIRTGNALIETQRLSLSLYGVTSRDTQDAIIAFSVERAVAREDLHALRLKLQNGLRDRIPAASQLALLKEYREAARKVKLDDDKALLSLDAKIGYSRNPHLESSIVLAGVLGDEKAVTEGPLGLGAFGSGYFTPVSSQPAAPR